MFSFIPFYQLGNTGNNFIFLYRREDLGMDLGETGWIQGVASAAVTAFGLLSPRFLTGCSSIAVLTFSQRCLICSLGLSP